MDHSYLSHVVLNKMVVSQLKQVIDAIGVSKTGLKAALQDRILQYAQMNDDHFLQCMNAVIKAIGPVELPSKRTISSDRVPKSSPHGPSNPPLQPGVRFRLSFNDQGLAGSSTSSDLATSKSYPGSRTMMQCAMSTHNSTLSSGSALRASNTLNNKFTEFDPSPFFNIKKALGPTLYTSESLCPMTMYFTLDPETKQLLDPKSKVSHSVLLFMGLPSLHRPAKLQYPESTSITCNQNHITGFSGLKKKSWTCQPANLTPHLLYGGKNTVVVRYTCPQYACHATVQLVENIPIPKLVQNLFLHKLMSKEDVMAQQRQVDAEDDVQTTLEQVSLKDPLSKCRIVLPIRGTSCLHIQCFDCETFLSVNQQLPTWECPICYRAAPHSSLFVDAYFLDILKEAGDVDTVEVTPDGKWRVANTADSSTPAKNQNMHTSSTTPNNTEMLIIDDDTVGNIVTNINASLNSATSLQSTPKKASNSDVIDLTLSDSDNDTTTIVKTTCTPALSPTPATVSSFSPVTTATTAKSLPTFDVILPSFLKDTLLPVNLPLSIIQSPLEMVRQPHAIESSSSHSSNAESSQHMDSLSRQQHPYKRRSLGRNIELVYSDPSLESPTGLLYTPDHLYQSPTGGNHPKAASEPRPNSHRSLSFRNSTHKPGQARQRVYRPRSPLPLPLQEIEMYPQYWKSNDRLPPPPDETIQLMTRHELPTTMDGMNTTLTALLSNQHGADNGGEHLNSLPTHSHCDRGDYRSSDGKYTRTYTTHNGAAPHEPTYRMDDSLSRSKSRLEQYVSRFQ
ncbi:E3 SUMO-protein ligase pli1 [Batrachochytrium dendrobatidis]